jgi:integrase/recombinase XerD
MNRPPRMRILALRDWPGLDQTVWASALRRTDLFNSPNPLTLFSKDQLAKKQTAYGRWLGFVIDDISAAPGASGLDHITPNNVTAFINKLKSLFAPYTVAGYVTDLNTVVRAFEPVGDLNFLSIAATNLRRQGCRISDKRSRLRPASKLYQLGLDLMRSAGSQRTAIAAAVEFRDGLMIALLAARPIRISNLASIEIDRHLGRHGSDYWLAFPAAEMKKRRHLEFPLPTELSLAMEQYLTEHRPILAAKSGFWKRGEHSGLWVSAHGSKLHKDRIYHRIIDRTRKRFGRSINPHLFRDAAATSIAIEDPSHVGIITTILGHSNTKTAETYYNQAGSLEAARSHQAIVTLLRTQSVGKA